MLHGVLVTLPRALIDIPLIIKQNSTCSESSPQFDLRVGKTQDIVLNDGEFVLSVTLATRSVVST